MNKWINIFLKYIEKYKDMILKIQYYKEEVIKSFIKRGHFPLEEEIQAKLDDIDYRTSLFKTYVSKAGSYFNTKEMNNMFELIYKDFEFLYNVLKDILINDYNDLKKMIQYICNNFLIVDHPGLTRGGCYNV